MRRDRSGPRIGTVSPPIAGSALHRTSATPADETPRPPQDGARPPPTVLVQSASRRTASGHRHGRRAKPALRDVSRPRTLFPDLRDRIALLRHFLRRRIERVETRL